MVLFGRTRESRAYTGLTMINVDKPSSHIKTKQYHPVCFTSANKIDKFLASAKLHIL